MILANWVDPTKMHRMAIRTNRLHRIRRFKSAYRQVRHQQVCGWTRGHARALAHLGLSSIGPREKEEVGGGERQRDKVCETALERRVLEPFAEVGTGDDLGVPREQDGCAEDLRHARVSQLSRHEEGRERKGAPHEKDALREPDFEFTSLRRRAVAVPVSPRMTTTLVIIFVLLRVALVAPLPVVWSFRPSLLLLMVIAHQRPILVVDQFGRFLCVHLFRYGFPLPVRFLRREGRFLVEVSSDVDLVADPAARLAVLPLGLVDCASERSSRSKHLFLFFFCCVCRS